MERHDEEKKNVVISLDDIKNVEDFFTHFKLTMPEMLVKAITDIRANPSNITFENQKSFRKGIAFAMISIDHPLIKDEAFKAIRDKCETAFYSEQFDKDIEEILTK